MIEGRRSSAVLVKSRHAGSPETGGWKSGMLLQRNESRRDMPRLGHNESASKKHRERKLRGLQVRNRNSLRRCACVAIRPYIRSGLLRVTRGRGAAQQRRPQRVAYPMWHEKSLEVG